MPAITPENSDEEEMDARNTPRFKRAIPNERRLNRRLRCRVCRENPARGATVPCLTLATAMLCVACFMDRHPQYVDSVVKVMVVDMKGKRGMSENGDLVAGEIVSETIINSRESPREHGQRSSPRNEKKAFENGFSNDSFGGKNVNRCLTEDFTKSEDGSQCSTEEEAWPDDVTSRAQPAAPATCSMINTPLGELDENDERDLVVFAMVARPVTKAERLVNAKAMASLDKEWKKLENQRVWIVEKGRSWREVAEEARARGEVAHVGRIFDICVENWWETHP